MSLATVNSKDTLDSIAIGWAIPLKSDTVLKLTPCPDGYGRKILFYSADGEWRALIERIPLQPRSHLSLNSSIAHFANNFIIGRTAQAIEPYLEALQGPTPPRNTCPSDGNLPSYADCP